MRCQRLAAAVGLGGKTWHAYLSVEHGTLGDGGMGPVNARDRIGSGPWYNVRGQLVAQDLASLHARKGDADDLHRRARRDDQRPVDRLADAQSARHPDRLQRRRDAHPGQDLLRLDLVRRSSRRQRARLPLPPTAGSSSRAWATPTDSEANCTSTPVPPNDVSSWSSAHDNAGCNDTRPRGGAGRLYCFATSP